MTVSTVVEMTMRVHESGQEMGDFDTTSPLGVALLVLISKELAIRC